jgi:hypothetical protein
MDIESELALAEDTPAVSAFLGRNEGTLERDQDDLARYWLTMRPRSSPAERYYPSVRWSRYPHAAPSVKFAEGVGGSLIVAAAWPNIPGYRLGPLDICKPFTSEGFIAHPEWATGPEAWPITGNPFLWVAETLQGDLDHRYGGRAS